MSYVVKPHTAQARRLHQFCIALVTLGYTAWAGAQTTPPEPHAPSVSVPTQETPATPAAPPRPNASASTAPMEEWGVWGNAQAAQNTDPLLGATMFEEPGEDSGDALSNTELPVGVSGDDELRINALDESEIGDFMPPPVDDLPDGEP
jgi:hypothetical protein